MRFSLSLKALDGRALVESPHWRSNVQPDFVQYLRGDDLARVSGDAVYADTRVNPDGTLDISRWARPQHDGPPLRALAVLRWLRTLRSQRASETASADMLADAERLLRIDLALTAVHWREPSLDIWEEELGHHYYTMRVSAAALARRRRVASRRRAKRRRPRRCAPKRRPFARRSIAFGCPDAAYYRSRDHARRRDVDEDARHRGDPRRRPRAAAATRLTPRAIRACTPRSKSSTQLFDGYIRSIANRPRERAPAMGRYEGDVYFSGGAYYFSTLGAAEFCFLAAAADAPGSETRARWVARGDAFLETVRAFTPASGDLSEQFDQRTGEQTSAKHLAWSYAAFISCVTARRAVLPP